MSTKSIDAENEDLISNLPNCILSSILSLLPTEDAVRTCVLSKDWEYKWTSIYNVDVRDGKNMKSPKSMIPLFINFMDRVFFQLTNLTSFNLRLYHKYDAKCMTEWISRILSHNVENVNINYWYEIKNLVILACRLINCISLRNLDLCLPCTFKFPGEISLNNLTRLCLAYVECLNENSDTHTLVFNFPVLRECTLKVKWLNVKYVEIYAPELITFISLQLEKGFDYSIKIIGNKLENFSSSSLYQEDIVMSSGLSIFSASFFNPALYYNGDRAWMVDNDIQVYKDTGFRVRRLLTQCTRLKYLRLSGFVCKALLETKLGHTLATYDKLERLAIIDLVNTEALIELLHAAPSLKFLDIEMSAQADNNDYDAITHIPSCVQHTLEEIKFVRFLGTNHQYNLVKFLVQNGVVLKKVSFCDGYPEHLVRRVQKFTASSCLEIVICENKVDYRDDKVFVSFNMG